MTPLEIWSYMSYKTEKIVLSKTLDRVASKGSKFPVNAKILSVSAITATATN